MQRIGIRDRPVTYSIVLENHTARTYATQRWHVMGVRMNVSPGPAGAPCTVRPDGEHARSRIALIRRVGRCQQRDQGGSVRSPAPGPDRRAQCGGEDGRGPIEA